MSQIQFDSFLSEGQRLLLPEREKKKILSYKVRE